MYSVVLLVFGALLPGVSTQAYAKDIFIGLRAHDGVEKGLKKWQATADYLSEQIEGYTFKLVAYDNLPELSAAANRGEFDYVITNPSSYVEMEINSGASRLLTLMNNRQGRPYTRFGSVIFTRSDRTDIKSLEDLRGKMLMAVSEQAFGGWRVAWGELLKNGIVPKDDLKQLIYAGGQQKVVYSVRDGKADAGVVRTDMLERMAANGLVEMSEFSVVGQQNSKEFPFLRSTALYPEWTFAKFPSAPAGLSRLIIHELLDLTGLDKAAIEGKYLGWSVPLNYQPVHDLLRTLKVGPYTDYGKVTLRDTLVTYRYWLEAMVIIVLLLFATGAFALSRNRQLFRLRETMLADRDRELESQKLALDEHAIVSITDVKGDITYVNDKFCEISGFSREELLGQNHRILKSGDHTPEFYIELWRTIANGKPWHGEIKNFKKGGGYYWVRASIVPFLNEQGKPFQYVAIRTDITDRKATEAALIESREDALAAAQAKSEFLANMSHEIRTPMNGVIGMLELLQGTSLNEEQSHYANTAARSADMQMSVINDILDFSKIGSGKLVLERVDFNICDVIEDIAALMEASAQAKGVILTCYCDPALPSAVKGDPTRLRQILANLVGNAVKFTDQGEINVAALLLSEHDNSVKLKIQVQDTGIGINHDALDTLFEEFTQADKSTTRKFGGTGLGLSISNSLADLMGTKIDVKSEVNVGSRFWLDLVMDIGNANENYSVDDLKGLHVLVVDDNATNREILEKYLSAWGLRPIVMMSSLEALEYLKRPASAVGLAILDYHMPEMNGVELAQAITSDPKIPTPPMIMLSSSQPKNTQDVLDAGIQVRLGKPIGRSKLLEGIMSVLGHELLTRQNASQSVTGTLTGKLLLVEDTFINQQVAIGILAKLGLNPDVAGNGREGVNKAINETYDLILMDVQMPEMDGFEATALLRQREEKEGLARTPIIAMTAHALEDDRKRCIEAGMDDYLAKPVRLETLETMLRKWMVNTGENVFNLHGPQGAQLGTVDTIQNADIADVLDADALKILRSSLEIMPEAYRDVLANFLESIPLLLNDIRAATEVNDPKLMEHAAHNLKSNSAMLGALRLSGLAAEIEAIGEAGNTENAVDLLETVEKEYVRVKPAVLKLLSSE